ncbi:MAG: PilZ domain-containing protein [Candidatus Omnitrophica bacterium]|nr:PilZ domain-containing protein [Candidatus Omnitrophota bacterium]
MNNNYGDMERRRSKRVRVNLTVIYRVNEPLAMRLVVGDKEIKGNILDLSEEGMAILTNYHLEPKTTVLLRFTLFKVEKEDVGFYGPMEIVGEVRYSIPFGEGEYRIGIYFLKIEPEDKKEIGDFVRETISRLKLE